MLSFHQKTVDAAHLLIISHLPGIKLIGGDLRFNTFDSGNTFKNQMHAYT